MSATNNTWTSAVPTTGTTYDWRTASNWGSGIPGGDENAIFNQTIGSGYTVEDLTDYGITVQYLTLDDTNVTFSIADSDLVQIGSTLSIDAGTLLLSPQSNLLVGGIGGSVVLDNGEIVLGPQGTIVGAGLTNGDGGGIYIEELDAGTAGTLDFNAGGTVVASGGTLEVAANVVGTGNFHIADGSALMFDFNVDSSSTITFDGTGTLIENYTNAPGLAFLSFDGSGNADSNLTVHVAGMTVGGGQQIEIAGDTSAILDSGLSSFTATGATIVIDHAGGGGTDTFYLTGDYAGDGALLTPNNGNTFISLDSVCFASGTHIETANGPRSVEALKEGDLVAVREGGEIRFEPVKWIGYRTLDLSKQPRRRQSAPIRIARGALGDNLPERELTLSPDHCLFLDGKLIPAKLLINDMTIRQDLDVRSVTYYHVELERHSILLAEGVPAESYLDTGNRAFFSNAGLALILHPEFHVNAGLRCWETDACAPLAVSPAAVMPVWRELADRAVALGYVPPTRATTTEADLHLLADGRRIDTISVAGKVHSFMIPAGITSLVLASRATAPSTLAAYQDDPRPLGVAVSRVTLRGQAGREEFAADHPALAQGWFGPEQADRAIWRWTNGHAALPTGVVAGPVIVEITLASTTTYLIDEAPVEGRLAA